MGRATPLVVGFGEVIYDHIFVEDPGITVYHGSRGGGSAFNVLMHLASQGARTAAIGVYGGQDPFGRLAKQELEATGIDTQQLHSVANKASRIVYELLTREQPTWRPAHEFHGKCLVCSGRRESSALVRLADCACFEPFEWALVGALVMDKMTNDRLNLLSEAKKSNPQLLGIVGISQIGHLRYSPIARILADISSFDLVFLDHDVSRSLVRRCDAEYSSPRELLNRAYPLNTLVVHNGSGGVDVFFRDDPETYRVPAPVTQEVVDYAGIGDVLVAELLSHLLTRSPHRRSSNRAILDAVGCAMSSLGPVLAHVGARGHLPMPLSERMPTSSYLGMDLQAIRGNLDPDMPCPFCLENRTDDGVRSPQVRKHKASLGRTLADLPRRTLFTFERSEAIEKCMATLESGVTAYVVGTGCSFSAAHYIAQVLTTQGTSAAHAMRPYDYARGVAHRSDWLLVVSYSGATHDCGLAIARALEMRVARIALITHAHDPPLGSLLRKTEGPGGDLVICYASSQARKERGFLSFSGTLMPSALFAAAALGRELTEAHVLKVFDEQQHQEPPGLATIVKAVQRTNVIDLFGGAFAWPAMIDFENKAVEGGVSAVQFHESKDFSHGRFMLLLNGRELDTPRLLFQVGEDPYEDELISVLQSSGAPFLGISTEMDGLLGGMELMIRSQFLAARLAQMYFQGENDITKPGHIPPSGLQLYRWKKGAE